MMRLLRPARSGIFLRSFRLHGLDHARETIAKICSLGAVLATAIISQTGSQVARLTVRPTSHCAGPGERRYTHATLESPRKMTLIHESDICRDIGG